MSKFKMIVIALVAFLSAGCASDIYIEPDSPMIKDQNASEVIKEYRIGVDDVITVNVWKNEELSIDGPVRPDGKISMPLIGDVEVAGHTPQQVSEIVRSKLINYVRDPNVTVMVTGLNSHLYLTRLRVTGAVNNQISLNYRQGMTVLDAILEAGGVNDFAAPNRTKLYRKISGKVRVISINLDDILYEGRLETNINLRPGDIITVPERMF